MDCVSRKAQSFFDVGEMKRKNRDTPGRRIAQAIIAQYKPKSVAEMQEALSMLVAWISAIFLPQSTTSTVLN